MVGCAGVWRRRMDLPTENLDALLAAFAALGGNG
jgi:hypothetical protein